MSAFEFFFSFYGLLLGLSVAALVSGLAGVLHERHRVRFGWLTPMLALFVAIDIATFWNQAWVIFRGAPFNLFLLILGFAVAATFYIAASITFPRLSDLGTEKVDLDDHFWSQRRTIFLCILTANLIIATTVAVLSLGNAEFARIGSSPRLWIGTGFFIACATTAALSRSRKLVSAALTLILLYSLWGVTNSAIMLSKAGGWAPALTPG